MKRTVGISILTALIAGIICLGVLMSGCTGQQPVTTPAHAPVATPLPSTVAQVISIPTTAAVTIPSGTFETLPSAAAPGTIRKLSITGSTTVLPIVQKAVENLMKKDSSLDIKVSGGGSGVGIQATGEGTADIGMSSRDVKADEKKKYPEMQTITIAQDGIAVIVHPSNPVSNLTPGTIQDIFSGQVNNWRQIGGSDQAIVVVGRDSASGTREFFTSSIMKDKKFVSTQLEKSSNGAVKQTVSQTPGAIGYISIGFVDTTVKPEGIEVNKTVIQPTVANIKSKTYPISRDLYLLTKGQPTDAGKVFIDYILSAEGQKIVQEEGYVPIST